MQYELKRVNVHKIADSELQRDKYLSDGYVLVRELKSEEDNEEPKEEQKIIRKGRPKKSA